MTAKVFLDNPYQTYSAVQLDFIKRAATGLPSNVVLRAAHQTGDIAALTLCFDIRVVSQLAPYLSPDLPDARIEALVVTCRNMVRLGITDTLAKLPRSESPPMPAQPSQERERVKRG